MGTYNQTNYNTKKNYFRMDKIYFLYKIKNFSPYRIIQSLFLHRDFEEFKKN